MSSTDESSRDLDSVGIFPYLRSTFAEKTHSPYRKQKLKRKHIALIKNVIPFHFMYYFVLVAIC
jgi:hypothetical protein